MIRSEHSKQANKTEESEPCWTSAEHSCVRLELADGSWLLLPYGQMQCAWLRPASPGETLELRFPSYQVRLEGGNLHKLAIAFQKHAVDSVRVAPLSERMKHGEGPAWVHSIEVEDLAQDQGADLPAPE